MKVFGGPLPTREDAIEFLLNLVGTKAIPGMPDGSTQVDGVAQLPTGFPDAAVLSASKVIASLIAQKASGQSPHSAKARVVSPSNIIGK